MAYGSPSGNRKKSALKGLFKDPTFSAVVKTKGLESMVARAYPFLSADQSRKLAKLNKGRLTAKQRAELVRLQDPSISHAERIRFKK